VDLALVGKAEKGALKKGLHTPGANSASKDRWGDFSNI